MVYGIEVNHRNSDVCYQVETCFSRLSAYGREFGLLKYDVSVFPDYLFFLLLFSE